MGNFNSFVMTKNTVLCVFYMVRIPTLHGDMEPSPALYIL